MSESLEHAGGLLEQDGLPVTTEEAEATPPPVAEAAPEPQQEAPKAPQHVPLAELLKERQARKAAAEEAARAREQLDLGTQELKALKRLVEERLAPPQAQSIPDKNTDPVAHFDARQQALEAALEEIRKERQQQSEASRQAATEQELVSRYVTANKEYAAEVPDWNQAYEHVTKTLFDEARLQGATEQQAWAYVHSTEKRLAQAAFSNGENPGRSIYEMAKLRGFAPKKAAPSDAETIATMKRGQAARGMGSAGGRPAGDYSGLTLAELVGMEQDDYEKVPDPIRRRLMGR